MLIQTQVHMWDSDRCCFRSETSFWLFSIRVPWALSLQAPLIPFCHLCLPYGSPHVLCGSGPPSVQDPAYLPELFFTFTMAFSSSFLPGLFLPDIIPIWLFFCPPCFFDPWLGGQGVGGHHLPSLLPYLKPPEDVVQDKPVWGTARLPLFTLVGPDS